MVDVDAGASNVTVITLTKDSAINIINPPPLGKYQLLHIVLIQDNVGGHVLTWDSSVSPTPTLSSGPNEITNVIVYSIDNGVTWHMALGTAGSSIAGANKTLSNLTSPTALNIDLNINDKDILGVKDIDFDGVSSTISGLHNLQFAQTSQSINSLSGEIDYQGAALDKHRFIAGGAEIGRFEEAAAGVYRLDMLAHSIKDSREHTFDNSTEAIITNTEAVIGYSPTTEAAMLYNVPTGKKHIKKINDTDIMTLSSTNLTFVDGHQTIFNPNATNAGVNVGLVVGDPSATNNGDLWYNSTTDKVRTKENGVNVDVVGGGGGGALDDLSDVAITTPTSLQVLRYNGASWVNATMNLGDIGDVILTSPATNSFVKYNGTNWIDSLIVDGDLPATVMHTDLVQTVTKQKTFSDTGISLVVTNRINMNGDAQIGNSILDEIFVNGFVSTDIHVEGRQAIRSNDGNEIGFFVTNDAGIPGGKGTVQIPHVNGSSSTASQADTDFGAYEGSIGIYMNDTSNAHVLVVRQPSGNWAGTILTDNTLV